MNEVGKATEKLFDKRKDFIIIGLTGRTGSGCSTVANLLIKDNLLPPKPTESDVLDNEKRKYKIVYEYLSCNWKPFILIEMKNIITSFILEHEFNYFVSFLSSIHNNLGNINNFEYLKNKLKEDIENEFVGLNNKLAKNAEVLIRKDVNSEEDEFIYHYYFEILPQFTSKLQNILVQYSIESKATKANLYTFLYQTFGNNIRVSGDSYSTDFNPDNIFTLSKRTNDLIKLLRRKHNNKALVVIDAFRNPFEAIFFKDRYAAFYLISINTDNDTRKERLIEKGLSNDEIKNLDAQEYPEKLEGIAIFSDQNIQKCIELSDIHFYNPYLGINDYTYLKQQIMKYVSLIMHPGLITPTHIERCMQIAYNVKLNSGCLSRQVGAVVTNENFSIRSVGWNSTPEGQTPCNLRNLVSISLNEDKEAFSHFEKNDKEYNEFLNNIIIRYELANKDTLKGRQIPYCFKDAFNSFKGKGNQVHTRALHAEENAFLQISKYGGPSIKDGILFTTASPCELCAKKAYQLGIKTIYYIDPYPGISNNHVLNCGSHIPNMILFEGAIGRAYTQIYTQILPYKDELAMILEFCY